MTALGLAGQEADEGCSRESRLRYCLRCTRDDLARTIDDTLDRVRDFAPISSNCSASSLLWSMSLGIVQTNSSINAVRPLSSCTACIVGTKAPFAPSAKSPRNNRSSGMFS